MMPDRQNPVPRAQMDAVAGEQTIARADVFERFNIHADIGGEVIEIGILADHAPLDQHPIGTDADVLAALLGGSEKGRRQNMTQAV